MVVNQRECDRKDGPTMKYIQDIKKVSLILILCLAIIAPSFIKAVKAGNIRFENETATVSAEIEVETEQMVQLSITHEKVAEIATDEATEAYFELPFVPYDFIPFDDELQEYIHSICDEYQIAYDLILAVIKTESEFQWIYGDEGNAVGYMQIWPFWWQETADSYGLNINEPADNIHLGIIILTDALNENGGDLNKALKQYNSGNPNYPGNEYVNKVFKNYETILAEVES